MKIQQLNEKRRQEFCIPLSDHSIDDDLFFCSLGTLFCTEAHGNYEIGFIEKNCKSPSRRGNYEKVIGLAMMFFALITIISIALGVTHLADIRVVDVFVSIGWIGVLAMGSLWLAASLE